jgi:hypothetical protein
MARWLITPRHNFTFKSNAILAAGREGPLGCETSRPPYCRDNRLTNGGEVVSLTRRPPPFTPQEDFWYSFLLGESTPGP